VTTLSNLRRHHESTARRCALEPGCGKDEDCNPETFYNSDALDGDADADGFISALCFNITADSVVLRGDDCNDANPRTHPQADEVCDYADNDCDASIDEAAGGTSGELMEPFYLDRDGDGYGDPATVLLECAALKSEGYVAAGLDCDDTDISVSPASIEICDDRDNDCNGEVDDSLFEPRPGEECVEGEWVPLP